MRSSLSSYIAAVRLAQGPLILTGLPSRIILAKAEELFYTVNFSRVKHNKEIIAINLATLRKKVKQEI